MGVSRKLLCHTHVLNDTVDVFTVANAHHSWEFYLMLEEMTILKIVCEMVSCALLVWHKVRAGTQRKLKDMATVQSPK